MSEMEKKSTAPDKSWLQRAAESEFFHNYKRSPSAIIGTVIVVLVLFIALCGPLFAPPEPLRCGLSLPYRLLQASYVAGGGRASFHFWHRQSGA